MVHVRCNSISPYYQLGALMTTGGKATTRPWAVSECGVDELFIVSPDGDGGHWPIAEMSKDGSWADAELIVRAVNSHDKLVAALEVLARFGMSKDFGYVQDGLRACITKEDCDMARAALNAVKGE